MRATMLGSLIAALLSSAACYTMRPVTLDELGAAQPARVWVTRADQSIAVVDGPRLYGDTLVGYVNGRFEEMSAAGLTQMRVRRRAGGRTAALIAAGAVGAAALVYVLSGSGGGQDPCSTSSSDVC